MSLQAADFGISDFSPEWDVHSGGAKMLLAAETVAGCAYAAQFGAVTAAAEVLRPHVLRLRVPPLAQAMPGWSAHPGAPIEVPLRLVRLSPSGVALGCSAAMRFTYCTQPPAH